MPIEPRQASQPQIPPFAPEAIAPLQMNVFAGINTATTRPGVPDNQCFWIDGFFPLAPYNARTLYDVGTALYTASGKTIIFFDFYVLIGVPYMVVLLSDGSMVQVNINTQVVTEIMPASTIITPSIVNVGVSQWGQQYLLIVANQTDGYWAWDGALLYTAGTVSPVVDLTAAGSGYFQQPAIIPTGGSGSGASFAAVIDPNTGIITGISVVDPGSGYLAGDSISLTFLGGTTTGSGASIVAFMSSVVGGTGASVVGNWVAVGAPAYFILSTVSVVNGGTGYSQFTTYGTNGGNPLYYATMRVNVSPGGSITSVDVIFNGYYLTLPSSSITINDPGNQYVSSVSIVSGGTAYSPSFSVTATGGSSPTATATFKGFQTSGTITSVSILSGGAYGGVTAPTVVISDSASTAAAEVTVMPYAVQGSSVETYQGYVWVMNPTNNTLFNSTPGSISDFGGDGAGSQQSNSSKLRVNYTRLIAASGFLYTISDSSIDYVSNVQTTGSPAITTYSWVNADPETGTPYPQGAMAYNRGLFFANAFGIHVMYGAQATKISEMLDGVYNSAYSVTNGFNNNTQLSVAEANIFGRKVALALVPIVDPIKNTTVNKIFIFDRDASGQSARWFSSEQSVALTYIKHQEINSVITPYGTNGTVVYPLFSSASSSLLKTIQSKLWMDPGGLNFNKGASRFWSLWKYNSTVSASIGLTIDALNNQNTFESNTYTITGPTATGFFNTPPEAVGAQGSILGMTIKTTSPDAQLIAAMFQPEMAEYRG